MKSLMSITGLALSLFGGQSSFASQVPLPIPMPGQFCGPDSGCSAPMIAINQEFTDLGLMPVSATFPEVFSGECYFLNMGADPSYTQYGVALLELNQGMPMYSGLFSFFANPNPYRNLNVEQARQVLHLGGSDPVAMQVAPGFFWVQFQDEGSKILYWFRQNVVSQDILLISRSVFVDPPIVEKTFCRLHPNRSLR